MHTKYKELIYPSHHSLEDLIIPQIERTRNAPQIKESFKSYFNKVSKML
jgi:hypothetical protein